MMEYLPREKTYWEIQSRHKVCTEEEDWSRALCTPDTPELTKSELERLRTKIERHEDFNFRAVRVEIRKYTEDW